MKFAFMHRIECTNPKVFHLGFFLIPKAYSIHHTITTNSPFTFSGCAAK